MMIVVEKLKLKKESEWKETHHMWEMYVYIPLAYLLFKSCHTRTLNKDVGLLLSRKKYIPFLYP